jgi:hypothetical protein
MSQDKNIEIIRRACIKANPDILKLEFGCRVSMTENTSLQRTIQGTVTHFSMPNEGGRLINWHIKPDNKTKFENFGEVIGGFTNNTEILGRPIRLADVLLAIQEADTPMSIETSIIKNLKNDPNNLYIYYRMMDGEHVSFEWNLRKDNLHDQSPECLEFLANLLSNK